jgi:5-methylcytosine-specific restriction enzyme subunit McrC
MRWYARLAIEQKTPGIDQILPTMRTDVVLEHAASGRRIVAFVSKNPAILRLQLGRLRRYRRGFVAQGRSKLRAAYETKAPSEGTLATDV